MSYLRLKCNKFDFGWSSAYSTPPAGRVRRLHRLFSCEADSTTKNDFLPSKGVQREGRGAVKGMRMRKIHHWNRMSPSTRERDWRLCSVIFIPDITGSPQIMWALQPYVVIVVIVFIPLPSFNLAIILTDLCTLLVFISTIYTVS